MGGDADHVVRFGPIALNPGMEQMLIPTAMLTEGGDDSLGLTAKCFDSLDALKAVESSTVNYLSFDIKNKPSGAGPANPPPPPPPPPPPGAK